MERKKTEEQLLEEIDQLRARVSELENSVIQKKLSTELILESSELYLALFMNNPVQTIVVDKDCNISAINEAQKNCGYRIPEIGSQMYVDYAGRHKIDMHNELLSCMKLNKIKIFPELNYSDGETFLSVTIIPFKKGAIITSQDITKRILAENELFKHQNNLEVLVMERTIELDKKNNELDNAIKVFAGREMTIRELRRMLGEVEGKE